MTRQQKLKKQDGEDTRTRGELFGIQEYPPTTTSCPAKVQIAWKYYLKESRQFFNQWEAKPKPTHHVRVIFPALRASYRWLLGIVIRSSRCSFPLWLVGVIAWVLVFRQSFENRSINHTPWTGIIVFDYAKLHLNCIFTVYKNTFMSRFEIREWI